MISAHIHARIAGAFVQLRNRRESVEEEEEEERLYLREGGWSSSDGAQRRSLQWSSWSSFEYEIGKTENRERNFTG